MREKRFSKLFLKKFDMISKLCVIQKSNLLICMETRGSDPPAPQALWDLLYDQLDSRTP